MDICTLDVLGDEAQKLYGRVRLFAAIGWAVGSFTIGALTDRYGFNINFVIFGVLSVVVLVLIHITLPTHTTAEKRVLAARAHQRDALKERLLLDSDSGDGESSQSPPGNGDESTHSIVLVTDGSDGGGDGIGGGGGDNIAVVSGVTASDDAAAIGSFFDVLKVLCRPSNLFFMFELLVMGAAVGIVERLLFVYMINDLKTSTTLCGLTVVTTVLPEIPIFWHGQAILRCLGRHTMLLISFFAYVVRAYSYTLLDESTAGWIVLVEVLHGVTFALLWTVAMDFANSAAPPGWRAAFVGVVSGFYRCIGGGAGSYGGGLVLQHYGGKTLYLYAAYIVAALMAVHALGLAVIGCFGAGGNKDGISQSGDNIGGDSGVDGDVDYSHMYDSNDDVLYESTLSINETPSLHASL
jgi:predicted MFS family arabinose efflux permease